MARHRPTVIYPIRPIGQHPQAYVGTASATEVYVLFVDRATDSVGTVAKLSRADARLLARRLNQCLDDSLSRPARKFK